MLHAHERRDDRKLLIQRITRILAVKGCSCVPRVPTVIVQHPVRPVHRHGDTVARVDQDPIAGDVTRDANAAANRMR